MPRWSVHGWRPSSRSFAHAAALNGAGSEVLGFDDAMSQDHDWGPRLLIFVSEADFAAHAERLVASFADAAPPTFLGVPVGLTARTRPPAKAPGALSDVRRTGYRCGRSRPSCASCWPSPSR